MLLFKKWQLSVPCSCYSNLLLSFLQKQTKTTGYNHHRRVISCLIPQSTIISTSPFHNITSTNAIKDILITILDGCSLLLFLYDLLDPLSTTPFNLNTLFFITQICYILSFPSNYKFLSYIIVPLSLQILCEIPFWSSFKCWHVWGFILSYYNTFPRWFILISWVEMPPIF